MTSQYPKLSISITPATKLMLTSISVMQQRPIWRIIEDSVRRYASALPIEDRRILEAMEKRSKQG